MRTKNMAQRLSQAWVKITESWITILVIFVVIALMALLVYWGWEDFVSKGIDQRGVTIRNFGLPILAIVGICLAVWRSIIAQEQADTAARSLQNDRYQKGAEMLGSEHLSVRIGGIRHNCAAY